MNPLLRPLALGALLAAGVLAPAAAAPDRDESGHGNKGRHGGREYKEEFWDGRCKVERKWEKNGEYKEKRKCKDHASRAPVYEAPVYAGPPPAVVVQPPAIVIQPPAIVVRP